MKLCKDCKHSGWLGHFPYDDVLRCRLLDNWYRSPADGRWELLNYGSCVSQREVKNQFCGFEAKRYERKWWKFWAPK